jgi:hypothetical protein
MSTRSFADATAELTGRDARTVRRAFERAEPAIVAREPRKPLQGGTEARKELAHA